MLKINNHKNRKKKKQTCVHTKIGQKIQQNGS